MSSGAARRRTVATTAARPRPSASPSFLFLSWFTRLPFAAIGACAFILTVGVSSQWDLPLIVLVICAALATVYSASGPRPAPPLRGAVLLFLAVTAISTFASPRSAESVRLNAALLPGGLLFFVIAERFETLRHTRSVYLSFSVLSLTLSGWLLWNAWLDGAVSPNVWALHAATPLLVVGNDVTFLAVIAPLSFALMCGQARYATTVTAGLSLVLTACVVGLFLSRGALLILLVSLGGAALLIRPRLAIAGGISLLVATVAVDAALGFPFAAKFGRVWIDGLQDGRTDLWPLALSSFREAPWFGHGPYTVVYTAADQRETMRWAHNLYLDVLVGQGLVGLGALGFLLARAFSHVCATHARARGETRTLNAAAFAALIGFCLSGFHETSLLRLWAVISFFALLGVIAHLSTVTATKEVESL